MLTETTFTYCNLNSHNVKSFYKKLLAYKGYEEIHEVFYIFHKLLFVWLCYDSVSIPMA